MSFKATAWLAEVTGLSASEFRVLFHLCDCHNPARGCFPTQAFLSARCEMAGSTLNAALSSLESKGLIARIKRSDPVTKKQLSTLYRFAFQDKPTPDIGDGADSDLEGEPTPIYGESRLRPTGDKPVKGTSKEPVIDSPDGESCVTGEILTLSNLPAIQTRTDVDEAFRLFNESAKRVGWPRCKTFGADRLKPMKARLKEAGGIEGWRIALEKAEASSFLTGGAKGGWVANIDFLLQKTSFKKLMEGNYDNRGTTGNTDQRAARVRGMLDTFAEVAGDIDGKSGGREGGGQDFGDARNGGNDPRGNLAAPRDLLDFRPAPRNGEA